jgi:hypothetical protein
MNRYVEVIANSPIGKFIIYRCPMSAKKRAQTFAKYADVTALQINNPDLLSVRETISGMPRKIGQLMEKVS